MKEKPKQLGPGLSVFVSQQSREWDSSRLFLTLEFSLLVPCSKKTFVGDVTLIWPVSEQSNIGQNSVTMKLEPSYKWNDEKKNSIV